MEPKINRTFLYNKPNALQTFLERRLAICYEQKKNVESFLWNSFINGNVLLLYKIQFIEAQRKQVQNVISSEVHTT